MTRRKHIISQTWIAVGTVLTALLLAACAVDRLASADDQVIRLSVQCQQPTRGVRGAESQLTTFDAGAQINVMITTSDATPVTISNGVFTATAASGGKNTLTPPDPTRPPYYPNGDKTVTIRAYYPSSITPNTTAFAVATDQTVTNSSESVDSYKKSDLMTAMLTGQARTANEVNLQFQHRMAKMTINATATDNLTIQSINLTNVQDNASYDPATDRWTGTGATTDILMAKEGTEATLSGVALFPAQTIEGKTFIQVVTNKGTANFVVTSKEFQEGHDYRADLEIGLQNLTMTAAITDWNAASGLATVTKVLKYGITIDPVTETFTYDGTQKTPSNVVVKFVQSGQQDQVLNEGTDYTLDYYNNTDVGEALIVAAGKGSYAGSAAVQSFYIGKANPIVSFTNGGSVSREYTWNDTYSSTLSDNSKYDGIATWRSSDAAVASVDGNGLVSINKPGTTTIRFTTDGSGNYEPASAQYTLTISKRSFKNHVSITTVGTYSNTYNTEAKEPVPVVWDGGTGGKRLGDNEGYYTVSYSNNVNAGTATVTCTGGGTFYDNTAATYNFTINKATPVITMTTTARTIGIGAGFQCDATTTYGTVTYSSSNTNVATVNSSGYVSAERAGTTTITASVAAGDNWNAATAKTISVTVQTQDENWSYTGAVQTYTCPATAIYTFEVVGAAGGNYSNGLGGKGGIVKASKKLTAGTVISVYVGGAGKNAYSGTGGINGSDTGYGGTSASNGGGSGGACSEIRINGAREIVAGGGGGSSGRGRSGKDGGSSSSGNFTAAYGESATYTTTGGGGGGGYYGGKQGNWMGGGYGGSNYAASGWTVISSGTSKNGATSRSDTNVYNGYVKMTYEFE